MYISYSFLSFLGICDTVKPKYAVEIHHQHIHIHIKDSVVQRFNVHLKITVKTDTCTLCPILFSGTLTAELPLTAGGLQCGAVLCFLINNSECIWNHTSSILRSWAEHSTLHISNNTLNMVRGWIVLSSWDSPSAQGHSSSLLCQGTKHKLCCRVEGGYLRSRGLWYHPRRGENLLSHVVKAKLGNMRVHEDLTHTYIETIKGVCGQECKSRKKSLPETSATGKSGTHSCS